MTASQYITALREKIGAQLLMLPSIAAVVRDKEERLLLQRKSGPENWSLPAGGIEPGETPQDALEREVLEETGRAVIKADLLGVCGGEEFRHRYPNGHEVEYTVVLFKCELSAEKIARPDAETLELRYFSQVEMPRLAQPYPQKLLFGR